MWKARTIGLLGIAFAGAAGMTPVVDAATNPASPTQNSSTGNLTITVNMAQLILISGIDDITINRTNIGGGDEVGSDSVCVWTNASSRQYNITATGDGAGNSFAVTHTVDGTQTLPYTVSWTDQIGTNAGLTSGSQDPTAMATGTSSTSCTNVGGSNATVTVTFNGNDLDSAVAGSYTGVLTLLVEPV